MEKYDLVNDSFVTKLIAWGTSIRKTFEQGVGDDFISTRRLCHIIHTFSIFGDERKAVELCINRYDEVSRVSWMDMFDKIGDGTEVLKEDAEAEATASTEDKPF